MTYAVTVPPRDPVNSARAKIAYWSRHDVGDPARIPAARRELAFAKLERHIREVLRDAAPLTPEERSKFVTLLLSDPAVVAA